LKRIVVIVAISILLLPLILNRADAQMITHERNLTLKVSNSKSDAFHTKVWKLTGYTFGERNIDVSDILLSKIKRTYHTDTFTFTLNNKVFQEQWLHFKVELIGTPLVGKGMTVRFI